MLLLATSPWCWDEIVKIVLMYADRKMDIPQSCDVKESMEIDLPNTCI
jgi:hypothetical protein